ncbi:MAG: UDP-glucose/GDP-mannose dehydrogenase family protein [Gemmatimonadota bacterium]|nr:UDP-glucose/GDP-mannose dehydrogenase family protein [Gemmatimonadota bacterium]MDQ8146753.1 UDP-glucose/GDP-mannose dehydrogenase family protein [Gemmatimonadota bacterium]MDQ8148903.1 UDP-glucose/GDP-mannose dehydrogenase family protein [Gemmatimonadota bacterium]MDQ8157340.1 UDP-glucose/GDP-mannose dehydrogenase family protein [Gemmatimonadota bacterium]MDQ8176106.1 UDP-glucose/GDP-mannose dehydrogenase family protein [Gemmatimonadota bacterium]
MNVTVVGTGYVGLVVGACLAETGNDVVCADVDAGKIAGLNQDVLPIYEPGLEEYVSRNRIAGRLAFTTDVAAAIASAEVIFIAVGTPPDEDGSADLKHVLAVAEQIGRHAAREVVVVTKSTVPVGTAEKVAAAIQPQARVPFHMCSNPEFLKEGAAVDDFMKPDRVVIGVASEVARERMGELYAPFVRTGKPVIFMDIPSAEMTKYAANAMLATRISFMNEIANLCEQVGANVDWVRKGIGSDSRIGPSFLFPGPGYGGSCFPKDVKALLRTSEEQGAPMGILRAVEDANDRQKHRLFGKLQAVLGDGLRGARIALWGLAFKANTDDMRESPALVLIEALLEAGATVVAHDPAAMHETQRRIGDRIAYAESGYAAAEGADALVVVTDWNEYRFPDFARIKAALRAPVLIDGRNLYDPAKLRGLGFVYRSIGRGRE